MYSDKWLCGEIVMFRDIGSQNDFLFIWSSTPYPNATLTSCIFHKKRNLRGLDTIENRAKVLLSPLQLLTILNGELTLKAGVFLPSPGIGARRRHTRKHSQRSIESPSLRSLIHFQYWWPTTREALEKRWYAQCSLVFSRELFKVSAIQSAR